MDPAPSGRDKSESKSTVATRNQGSPDAQPVPNNLSSNKGVPVDQSKPSTDNFTREIVPQASKPISTGHDSAPIFGVSKGDTAESRPKGAKNDTGASASLLHRLAGPSVGKAGLARDQTEITRIIARASEGSKYYEVSGDGWADGQPSNDS